jgi:hypothetical protein
MNLIDTYCLVLLNECIKHVFTKVLSFNDHLLLFCMSLRVKGSQSVDTIGFLWYSGSDWSRVQSEHACSSDNWDLGSSGNEYLESIVFKLGLHLVLQVGTLWETSYHKNEINWESLFYCSIQELFYFIFNLNKEWLEEAFHYWRRQVNATSSS